MNRALYIVYLMIGFTMKGFAWLGRKVTEDLHDRVINAMPVIIVALLVGYNFTPKNWQWLILSLVVLCTIAIVFVSFAYRWNDDVGEDYGYEDHDDDYNTYD